MRIACSSRSLRNPGDDPVRMATTASPDLTRPATVVCLCLRVATTASPVSKPAAVVCSHNPGDAGGAMPGMMEIQCIRPPDSCTRMPGPHLEGCRDKVACVSGSGVPKTILGPYLPQGRGGPTIPPVRLVVGPFSALGGWTSVTGYPLVVSDTLGPP
jgi:hypothetical protein